MKINNEYVFDPIVHARQLHAELLKASGLDKRIVDAAPKNGNPASISYNLLIDESNKMWLEALGLVCCKDGDGVIRPAIVLLSDEGFPYVEG